eukprot:Seg1877.5 transcript_id=Seg1877.5/GoldUCD/mRNA.D3Y31 product="Deoxynucleotidyltransferase terminal-interacting protein 1" protein_id=Seg1877.5/GoldUCD/D3Y31
MVENSQAAKVGAPSAMSQTTPRIQQNKEVIFRANPQRLSMDGTPGTIKLKRKRESLSDGRHEAAANPFNMTARNFPKRRPLGKAAIMMNRTRANTSNNPAKALELVRAALQPSLNADIERVLVNYQEMFRMAAYNISDNTKEPISEDHVKYILRRSLDEAKSIFKVDSKDGDGEQMSKIAEKREVAIKPVIIRKKKIRRDDHREKPRDDYNYPSWDESRLTDETELIMGVKANKILGFASARGRLYSRHPDLFKYMADQDDKQWLYDNGHMPITGGKAFLMIADDIRNLATTHQDYKDNLGITREDIKGFVMPTFMIQKVKAAIKRAAILREVTKKPAAVVVNGGE